MNDFAGSLHAGPGGIVAVDDHQHPGWQDVTTAVDVFVAESGFAVVADVNRWGEPGRKIYLSAHRSRLLYLRSHGDKSDD